MVCAVYIVYMLFSDNYDASMLKLLVKVVCGIFSSVMFIYAAYYFSFSYELKQKEVVVSSLLLFWRKKRYSFEDLSRIEFVISTRGVVDTIKLYFGKQSSENKITIVSDIGSVRLFLFANVENFEELVVERQRTWGR